MADTLTQSTMEPTAHLVASEALTPDVEVCRVFDSQSLRCHTLRPSDIDGELLDRWRELRASNPALVSPFFSAEFTLAVGTLRNDCFVAMITHDEQPIAFLPYHRVGKTLYPIGRMINDAHGLICEPTTVIPWDWLLRSLGAWSYDYHALFTSNTTETQTHAFGWSKAFLCDLSAVDSSYDVWLAQNRKTIFKQQRKTKKLVKTHGPLRLEYASQDPQVLDWVIDLKRQQYQRTRIFDIFSVPWIRELMHYMLTATGELQGRLSVLYAGDRRVAGHMGMQENSLLHYWFPVYDQAFGYASPGTALFLEIVKTANENHIEKIDFGYGELPYKWTLNNVIDSAPYGAICLSRPHWHLKRMRNKAAKAVKQVPCKELTKRVLRSVRPGFGGQKYH